MAWLSHKYILFFIVIYVYCIIPGQHTKRKLANWMQRAGTLPFSVIITSVWELPYLWMWSTASCMLSTTSMQHSRSPYSVRNDFTSDGLKVRYDANLGPACIFTCIWKVIKEEIRTTCNNLPVHCTLMPLQSQYNITYNMHGLHRITCSVLSRSMIWSNSGVRSTSLWTSRVSIALQAAG